MRPAALGAEEPTANGQRQTDGGRGAHLEAGIMGVGGGGGGGLRRGQGGDGLVHRVGQPLAGFAETEPAVIAERRHGDRVS